MADAKKKGFNLAEALSAVNVPNLGTTVDGREQIEYIDIDRIDDDPNNFYGLSALDELATNIDLLGLQQPLRVRSNPQDSDRVIIVSGHRRRAAIRKLVDDGREDLREIPCIRERADGSAALQELRLIYANSDTRHLTSAEISRQVERVEALLYQLKEEGYDFPGRMRDHVAEACNVSKSKIARLKVIRDGLDPAWKNAYEKEGLPESTAYTLARLPAEHQRAMREILKSNSANACWFREHEAETLGKKMVAIDKLVCKKTDGESCTNLSGKYNAAYNQGQWRSDTPCSKCCEKCENLASCKNACPKQAEKVKRLKDDAKAQRKQEKLAKAEADRPIISEIKKIWNRFGEARAAADKSVKQYYEAMGMYYSASDEEDVVKKECLEAAFTTQTDLPFKYFCRLSDARALVKIADLLGCSLDYLFCRTDDPNGRQPVNAWTPATTTPGDAPSDVIAVFDIGDGKTYKQLCYWDGANYRYRGHHAKIEMDPIRWLRVPDEPEATI